MFDPKNPRDSGAASQKGAADSVAGQAREGAGKASKALPIIVSFAKQSHRG